MRDSRVWMSVTSSAVRSARSRSDRVEGDHADPRALLGADLHAGSLPAAEDQADLPGSDALELSCVEQHVTRY